MLNRLIIVVLNFCWAVVPAAATDASTDDGAITLAFLRKYCVECHGVNDASAEFSLHDVDANIAGGQDLERWEKVLELVSIGDMPPEDALQPQKKERDQLLTWLAMELRKVGRGPVAGQAQMPAYGNRVDHDSLFSGEHQGPASTQSRLWRISPEIYQRFASRIDMARKLNAPLQIASAEGIRDYALLYADEATIKTMLQNCKRAATTLIHGRIKTQRNRSSTQASIQGGRTGTRHKAIAAFLNSDQVPSQAEMEDVLQFAIRLLLQREMNDHDQVRYVDGFLRFMQPGFPMIDLVSRTGLCQIRSTRLDR